MLKKIFLLIFLFKIFAKSEDSLAQMDLDLVPEDYSHVYSDISDITNVRRYQQNKKIQNEKRQTINSNKTMFLDGVKHMRFSNDCPQYSKMKKMEDDFRNLISMEDYKFVYKRGLDWRTWRRVKYCNGSEVMVCYRCHSTGDVGNCEGCHNTGFWSIEDEPPCPYEVFSMRTKDKFCVLNYAMMNKNVTDCIQLLDSIDLTTACDNPIVTTWIFNKIYSQDSARPSLIAAARESFLIKTIYWISSSGIVFRIINSSNRVIYSKIMRSGDVDFACVNDCGYWDPKTMKIKQIHR